MSQIRQEADEIQGDRPFPLEGRWNDMPRPQKEGLDYFPLDVTFFSDPKIKLLKARYGVDGIAVYIYLLCEIYRSGYYLQLNDDSFYIFSDDLKMSVEKVMQVLNFLLERSLFDHTLFQSDKVLTSAGIQERFQLAVKERAKKNPVHVEGFWILKPENTEPFIKVNSFLNISRNNEDNSGKNGGNSREKSLKESKEKESKENKRKDGSPEQPGSPIYELPMLDGSMYPVPRSLVEEYRSLYPSVDVTLEFRKMIKWLDVHPKKRKTSEDIEKFINGWLGRSQDSARAQPSGGSGSKNRFKNFEERDQDYESIIWEEMRRKNEKGEG